MPSITVSFACPNSAMAAKMIEYFDKLSAESVQQLCDNLRDHPEQWTEFAPDGSSRPATEPLNFVPPHVSHPNSSSVPPNAAGSAPTSYQQQQQQYTPPAQSAPPAPPAPPAQPQQSAQPMPQQPNQPPQAAPQAAPQATQQQQQPNYQQTAMSYTPAPNNMPAASAPVIKREQLNQALQVFASSSQAHQIQIRELLARFGIDAINALPDASIPEFVNSLRELGCYI